MKKLLTPLALAVAHGGASGAQALEGDAKAGQQAATLCSSCHQPDGSGMNIAAGQSWPRLAGLDADYLYKQLQDFKNGSRQSPIMMPFVNSLSDQQDRKSV